MNKLFTWRIAAPIAAIFISGCEGDSTPYKDKTTDTNEPSATLPTIYLNEVMTSNTASFPDEVGSFEDWIELWNSGEESADISGWWLSDDLGDVFKWQFPEGTVISGGGFLILFADEDQEEGPLHVNFQLDADAGESIGLFGANTNDNPLIDSIDELLPIQTDWSFARQPDGGDLVVDDTPTPGAPNN